MWKILQHKTPEDFVISTGKQYSVKEFINIVSKELNIKIKWKGKGLKEKAYDENNKCIIAIDKRYYRASEVDTLKGNYSKAKRILRWKPKITIIELVKDMINNELKNID